jgi:hypothetical protein
MDVSSAVKRLRDEEAEANTPASKASIFYTLLICVLIDSFKIDQIFCLVFIRPSNIFN